MNIKIRHLREQMKSLNLEGMIVSNPVNIRYLSNIKDEGVLLITRRENIFITYTMYLENVKNTLTIDDEIIVMDFRDISKEDFENFFIFCENVGFEEKYVTYEGYKNIFERYKANNLVETEGLIEKQRMIKDEEELDKIKTACEITDKCFLHLLNYIKKGMTEKEVAIEIERFFKLNGADGVSFSPIVASGVNSAIAHWEPSDKKIETGDPILIDMGCKYQGYASDMTRTIFMGCILEEIKPIYDLVLKNQLFINEQLKDGSSIKILTKILESNFKAKKFELIHSLGHGIGLDVHEVPSIKSTNESFLKENMVITNEPAIYIPGKYGIRIEDTLCITKNSSIVFTNSEKNYIVI